MSGPSLEQRLLRAWYDKAAWLALLRPLSALYRCLAVRRRQAYLTGARAQWQPRSRLKDALIRDLRALLEVRGQRERGGSAAALR